jgi:hypothetical protein
MLVAMTTKEFYGATLAPTWPWDRAVIGSASSGPRGGASPNRCPSVLLEGVLALYFALALTSLSAATGQPRAARPRAWTSPPPCFSRREGRLLVSLVGLAVIGVGGYHVVKGWTRKFLRT